MNSQIDSDGKHFRLFKNRIVRRKGKGAKITSGTRRNGNLLKEENNCRMELKS